MNVAKPYLWKIDDYPPMHELPVTQSLLKIALDHAEKANAKQITALNIVMGELASMVDDSIQFYWEVIAKDTIAEKATLNFRRVDVYKRQLTYSVIKNSETESTFG